jgi:hypothetical protein
METYDQRIAELTHDPTYRRASTDIQRERYLDVLNDELKQSPEYLTASVPAKQIIMQSYIDEDFRPTYSDDNFKAALDQTKEAYLAGDMTARDAMMKYSESTQYGDRLSLFGSIFNRMQNVERTAERRGMPGEYANSPLNILKTYGADDNRARQDIRETFMNVGDTQAVDQMLNSPMYQKLGAANATEEIIFALAANVISGGAYSAVNKAGKVGTWFARNSPALLREAGMEGLRGAIDNVNRNLANGNDAPVSGALKAFGTYAALDVAISHVATALLGQVGKGARLFREAEQAVNTTNVGKSIARGGNPTLSPLLSEPHVRHASAGQMYDETNIIMGREGPGFLDEMDELRRANYDAHEAGYRLTALPEDQPGKYIVQEAASPKRSRTFKNVEEFNDWVGEKLNMNVNRMLMSGDTEEAIQYAARHPAFQYGRLRQLSDENWAQSTAVEGADAVPINSRQHVNELEFREASSKDDSKLTRFAVDLSEEEIATGKVLYRKDQEVIPIRTNPNGNASVRISQAASKEDWDLALKVAEARKAELQSAQTTQALARDDLIRKGYDAVDLGNGEGLLLLPDNVKIINNRINPVTGKIGKIEYAAPAKVSTGAAKVAQKGAVTKRVVKVTAKKKPLTQQQIINAKLAREVQRSNLSGEQLRSTNITSVFESDAAKLHWLDTVAVKSKRVKGQVEKLRGSAGEYKVRLLTPFNEVVEMTYDNLDTAFRDIIAIEKVPDEIGLDLAKFGYQLEQINAKYTFPNREFMVKTKSGVDMGRYTDTNIWNVYEDLAIDPSVPSRLQPDLAYQTEIPTNDFVAGENVSLGFADKAAKFQGQFVDAPRAIKASRVVEKPDGRKILKIRKTQYEAEIPELNHTEAFDSAAEAQKYINNGWKASEALEKAAKSKGVNLGFDGGEWKIYYGDKTFTAKTRAEAIKEMGTVRTPTSAKELIPENLLVELDKLGFELNLPPGFTQMRGMANDMIPRIPSGFNQSKPVFWNSLLPAKQAMRRMMRSIDPAGGTGLGKAYEKMLTAMDVSRAKTFQDAHEIAEIFKGYTKNVEKKKGIFHYLEAEGGSKEAATVKEWDLTSNDIEVAGNLKKFYERKAIEIGVPFEKLIKQYQPHMRDWANKTKAASVDELITHDLIQKNPYAQQFLRDNPFYARMQEERTLDGFRDWFDQDSMRVAMRYSAAGNRAFYANDAMGEFYDLLKANKKIINESDNGLIHAVNQLRESFTHPGSVMQMEEINKGVRKMFGKILPKGMEGNPAGVLLSLPSLTNMTLRFWLPVRNGFQVMTVGSLRTGNLLTIGKGISKVPTRKALRETTEQMIEMGIIAKKGALTNEYLDLIGGAYDNNVPKLIDLMRKGLKPYAMSDDWTRAVMFHATNDIFEKALKKSTVAGRLNVDSMIKGTMANTLDPAQTALFRSMLDEGNLPGAKALLAKYNIEFTMFDYSILNKPLAANSVFGHMYYQMGTFSTNFAQSIMTAGRNGMNANGVKQFMAMGAGMTMVALLMKQLGVNNSSFLPWKMAMFGGGPWFDTIKDVTSLSAPGLEGDMARKNLSRQFLPARFKDGKATFQYPAILPGSLHFKYLARAVAAYQDGDYHKMALALGTIPEYRQ